MADLFSQASKLLPHSADEASTLLCMAMVQLDLEEHESAAVVACRNVLRFEMTNSACLAQLLHRINQRLGNLIAVARSANKKPIPHTKMRQNRTALPFARSPQIRP